MVAVGVQSIEKPAKMKTNKQQSLFFLFIYLLKTLAAKEARGGG
jgi:hypothetical protein